MKSGPIQPKEGVFDFTLADQFIEFGVKNNLHITGHCLVWHSQAPCWFFTDSEGNDVSREVLLDWMKKHIYTVVVRQEKSTQISCATSYRFSQKLQIKISARHNKRERYY